jgi:hypothetical protein
MKRILIAAALGLFSYQALAITTTVAGIDFIDVANTLDAHSGSYLSNANGVAAGEVIDPPTAIVDGNGASWVMSGDATATLDVSFGGSTLNVADRDLTILLVGNKYPHSVDLSLLTGSSASTAKTFTLDSSSDINLGYTGYNSVTPAPPASPGESAGTPTTYGIYALNIHLADAFTGVTSFDGVRLDISGYSAVPSLVGTVAPVPVPAAVWLFGSGLLGQVGVVRKRG